MERWQSKNGVTITNKEDMDIDSFKKAVDGVDEWFVKELEKEGYDDAQELVDLFTQESTDTVADYSDLNWPEATWNFACSTTETSTWADGGRKFGELMEKATVCPGTCLRCGACKVPGHFRPVKVAVIFNCIKRITSISRIFGRSTSCIR